MRIVFLPDPARFEHACGLRTQVLETMNALGRLGVDVVLPGRHGARAARCDLVHAFGAARANTPAAGEPASRIPVVLSPRISPAWTSVNGTRARVGDRVLGNRTCWDVDTGYAQTRRALLGASLVVAASEGERRAVTRAFLAPERQVCVIGSGIAQRFFRADPALFRERWRIAGPFALMAGQVSPWHGQLEVAQALAGLALPLVVIGCARERDAGYHRMLRALRTVVCVETLAHDDPLLASAYAAASVLVLPARGASMPIAALEALASGTPVVARWPVPEWRGTPGLYEAAGTDGASLGHVVSELLAHPGAAQTLKAAVANHTWDSVARQLLARYETLLGG